MVENSLRDNQPRNNQLELERAGYPTQSGYNGSTVDIPALWLGNANINTMARFNVNSTAAQVYSNFRDSVAHITVNDGINSKGQAVSTDGTGFFVKNNGVLATDYHVIKDADKQDPNGIRVQTSDGRVHIARVITIDPSHDLALLQVQPLQQGEQFKPVVLSPNGLSANDLFTTLGYPKSSDVLHISASNNNKLSTLGTYSVAGGLYPGESPSQQVYASEMNVAQGNSGGPVFDSHGRVGAIIDLTNENNLAVSTPVQPLIDLINRTAGGTTSGDMQPGYYYAQPNYYSAGNSTNPYASAFQSQQSNAPGYYDVSSSWRQSQSGQPVDYGTSGGAFSWSNAPQVGYGNAFSTAQPQQSYTQQSLPGFTWRTPG